MDQELYLVAAVSDVATYAAVIGGQTPWPPVWKYE